MNMYPEDWRQVELQEVAELQTGLAKGATTFDDPIEMPYLRVANVQDGYLDLSEIKTVRVERSRVDRYRLRPGDVLLTEGGDFDKLGRGTVWQGEIECCLHQNHVFVARPNADVLLPEFLSGQTSSPYGKQYFLTCAKQTTNLASINSTQLKQFPVLLPPLPEQRKIVEILSTWVAAIQRAEQLVAALLLRKKGLMQRMLVPSKETGLPSMRLPKFTKAWQFMRFFEVAERITRKNTVGNQNVLTASGQHGLINQTEFFNRTVASESLEGYYLLQRGEFAYNRSSMNGYPYGAIKQLTDYDAGVLSTLYLCFALTADQCDPSFYRHFFEAGGMNRGIYSIAQEGARNHGLLNVSANDFFGLTIPVPDLAEQRHLAELFDIAGQEIDLQAQYLSQLREQKRGLMQRLLTGEVRVSSE